MRTIISVLLIFLMTPVNGINNESTLIHEAKKSVQKILVSSYHPEECRHWNIKQINKSVRNSLKIKPCDYYFNKSKMTFSYVKSYKHNIKNVVCGVITSNIGSIIISTKFIYIDDGEKADVKLSRHPVSLSGDFASETLLAQLVYNEKESREIWCR